MSEWINVNDRVPEIGKRVLVFQKDGVFGGFEIDICFRLDESYPEDPEMNNRIVWDGQGISNHIYYWMPLPESPKENIPSYKKEVSRIETDLRGDGEIFFITPKIKISLHELVSAMQKILDRDIGEKK